MWTFLFMLASLICLTLGHLLKTISLSQKISLLVASAATGVIAWLFLIFSSHSLVAVLWTAYLVLFWLFRKDI